MPGLITLADVREAGLPWPLAKVFGFFNFRYPKSKMAIWLEAGITGSMTDPFRWTGQADEIYEGILCTLKPLLKIREVRLCKRQSGFRLLL